MADFNFNLCTINHTGTHFAFALLEYLYCRNDYVHGEAKELAPLNPAATQDVIFSHIHYRRNFPMAALNNYILSMMGTRKTMVTLLHPERWLIAHISRNEFGPDALSHWDVMIEEVTKYPVVYLDILCPPQYRVGHVTSLLTSLGIYIPQYDPLIAEFCATMWIKYGSVPTIHTSLYEANGHLPDISPYADDGWSMLTKLITWYDIKIAELQATNWII